MRLAMKSYSSNAMKHNFSLNALTGRRFRIVLCLYLLDQSRLAGLPSLLQWSSLPSEFPNTVLALKKLDWWWEKFDLYNRFDTISRVWRTDGQTEFPYQYRACMRRGYA